MSYFGDVSKSYQHEIKRSFKRVQPPGSKLIFYYKKLPNLQNIFANRFKNIGCDTGKSGVYKINCMDCDKFYIGQTGRPLSLRLNEHKNYHGVSGRYATYDHSKQYNHKLDFNNAHLICTEFRNPHRLILESLLMKGGDLFENNSSSKKLNVFD